MQGECNSKTRKQSFTGLDTAEPQLILYKDNANERKKELALVFPSAAYLIQNISRHGQYTLLERCHTTGTTA